jgi:MbtH protein
MSDDVFSEYYVAMNDEEQYSIWPSAKSVPAGWHLIGNPGTKEECISYIDKTWTDMRPKSLREDMASRGLG